VHHLGDVLTTRSKSTQWTGHWASAYRPIVDNEALAHVRVATVADWACVAYVLPTTATASVATQSTSQFIERLRLPAMTADVYDKHMETSDKHSDLGGSRAPSRSMIARKLSMSGSSGSGAPTVLAAHEPLDSNNRLLLLCADELDDVQRLDIGPS
jgi:hypothetical protein